MASRFLTLPDGTRARYWDAPAHQPDAPTVLLLHGANLAIEIWEPWFGWLAGRFRLVAVDLPGHGRTTGTTAYASAAKGAANFVDDFATALRLDRPFALAGHSFGGEVAWRFSLRHPERVSRLALIAPAGLAEPGGAQRALYRLARTPWGPLALRLLATRDRFAKGLASNAHDPRTITPELADVLWRFSRAGANPTAAIARIRALSVESDTTVRLGDVRAPTLLLWGRQDAVFPPALADRFAAAIPGARVVFFDACGHFPMLEAAEASADQLAAFLEAAPERTIPAGT